MDVFTLGEYAIKAAIEVGRKIKTLNTTEVDSGIAEAYKRALSDWSQHAPTSSDELRLNTALDGYIKNATSYEALDQDTKDFIDCFKKRLSEQPAAHNYLMTLRADEQAKSEELNLQEHRKTQVLIQNFMAQMSGSYMNLQDISQLFKELPLNQGVGSIKSTLEKMRSEGRIPSEEAKKSLLEIALHKFEYSNEMSKEATQLRIAGDKPLAQTFEEINRVLTGDSEQSLTAIYEKLKEQERQNEVRALKELIAAAQIQFSFGEARGFYERLIELAPTVENHFNYALMLQSLNDFEKAISHYEAVLQVHRELSDHNTEAYKLDVATTLNNLGNLLYYTNELKQAKAYYEEARLIYKELAEMNPEAYKPDLAGSLNNLGNLHSHINELKQARTYYEEARLIYQESAEKNPEAYKPKLAMTLNNLGNLLSDTNELKQARAYYEEASLIYKELAEMNPEAYKPDLASSLNNLGNLLSDTNELKQARAYYEEARLMYKELAEMNPEAYKPDLAMTLNNLGSLLHDSKEFKQARACFEEALKLYQELADLNPKAYMSDVAMTLNNLVVLYMKLKKKEEAVRAYQGAYNVYKKLASLHPKAYDICYARILAIGYAFLGEPQQDLKEAKAILSKYPEHPKTQGLLSFIEGLYKREQ